MATLYEINEKIANFDYQFDEETGEWLNEKEFNELGLQQEEKIENTCLFIKNLESDIEAYKNEKKAFDEKIKKAERHAERLKKNVEYTLNGEKFHSDKVDVTYRKSERVEVTGVLFEEYMKKKVDVSPDKDKIKKAIKAGIEVEGAKLVECQNMQIK